MKVKPTQRNRTSKKSEVIKIVIFVEPIGTIHKLRVIVLSIDHFIDEVEGRNSCQYE